MSDIKDVKEVMDEFRANDTDALQKRITQLEEMLRNARKLKPKSIEEELILTELKRMWDVHVVQDIPMMETQDVKKVKILVEALSIVRNGTKEVKKKDKEMSVEEALRLVAEEE